jgi:hypothetical protein
VETNNIVVDGSGFTLQGSGGGVAVNLTCINVRREASADLRHAGGYQTARRRKIRQDSST